MRSFGTASPTYNNRNRVERLKGWRTVATRYEMTASSFAGIHHLAAALGDTLAGRDLPDHTANEAQPEMTATAIRQRSRDGRQP